MGNASPQRNEGAAFSPQLSILTAEDSLKTLRRLCDVVTGYERPYEDVAEQIEDRAYEICESGDPKPALEQLSKVAYFFEHMGDKNEEQSRDLADVYLLIGQIYQFAGQFVESILWFLRSTVVDDRYPAPFHSLATSYTQLEEYENAVKSLEQEIALAPGNYYSYLLLADLYQRSDRKSDIEACLKRLLERDPENIQGLHRLIRFYSETDPGINTSLLQRRILGVGRVLNRIEAVIRCYYLCREKRFDEAIDFLDKWHQGTDGITITFLVKAHVFGERRQYARRRKMLAEFKMRNHGREEVMLAKLREFASVFGTEVSYTLQKLLFLSPCHG